MADLNFSIEATISGTGRDREGVISVDGAGCALLSPRTRQGSRRHIAGLDIPTGIPLVYELDDSLWPIRHYYLADQAELDKAVASVKSQGKAK